MNQHPESLEAYHYIKSHNQQRRLFPILATIAGYIVPVAFFSQLVMGRLTDWSWTVLWRGIIEGVIIQDPAKIIWQDNYSVKMTNDGFGADMAAFLLFIAITALLTLASIGLIRLGFYIVSRLKAKPTSGLHPQTLLRQLFPSIRNGALKVGNFAVSPIGKSVVVQTAVKLPTFFVDSLDNDLRRLEKRELLLAPTTEMQFDGTTYDHIRIFAPEHDHLALLPFFDSERRSFIIKQLEGIELISQEGVLTAIVNAKEIKNPESIDKLLARLSSFIEKAHRDAVPTSDALSSRKARFITWRFGIPMPRLYSQIIATLATILLSVYIVRDWGSITNSEFMVSIALFALLTLVLWIPRTTRHVRAGRA